MMLLKDISYWRDYFGRFHATLQSFDGVGETKREARNDLVRIILKSAEKYKQIKELLK